MNDHILLFVTDFHLPDWLWAHCKPSVSWLLADVVSSELWYGVSRGEKATVWILPSSSTKEREAQEEQNEVSSFFKKKKTKKENRKKKSQSLLRLKWNSVLLWNRPPIQHRTIYLLIFNSRELQYYLTPPRTLYNDRLLFKSLFFPPKQSVQRMNGLFAPNAIQMFKSKILIWFIFSSLLFFVC